MFKKQDDVVVTTRTLLRQKEAKQLHELISLLMPGAGERNGSDMSCIASLLPVKAIETRKLATKLQSYGLAGEKVSYFVDTDSKSGGKLIPSVYALWRCPGLVPSLVIPPQVSTFIVGGADLMLPGVLESFALPNFVMGTLLSIRVAGNPSPIAVGTALLSTSEAVAGGMRGRGVRVLHHYGDALWDAGGRGRPNEGFQGNIVLGIGSPEAGLPPAEGVGLRTLLTCSVRETGGEETSMSHLDKEGKDEDEVGVPWWRELSGDALFYATLHQTLRRHIKPTHLPMLSNVLFGTCMAAARPSGVDLDPKKTSWRKVSVFLKAMAAEGILNLSEESPERPGVLVVTGFDKHHPAVKRHRLWPAGEEAGRADAVAAAADEEEDDRGNIGAEVTMWLPPVVTEYLRPHAAGMTVVNTVLAAKVAMGKVFSIPGRVLAHRGRHRGGPRTAKSLGLSLVPAGEWVMKRGLERKGGGVVGEEEAEDGGGEDEEDAVDEAECKVADRADTASATSAEPANLPDILALLPPNSQYFLTKAEALALLGEYCSLRSLQDRGKDIEARKCVRLDEHLARAVAKCQAKGSKTELEGAGAGGQAGRSVALDDRDVDEEYDEDEEGGDEEKESENHDSAAAGGSSVTRAKRPLPIVLFDVLHPSSSLDADARGELADAPSLAKDSVGRAWCTRMEAWHAIQYRTGGEMGVAETVVRRGAPPCLRVSTRKVQGKRALTCLTGFEAFRLEPQDLASRLQRLVAGSATVQPVPTNPTIQEVAVQGNESARVCAYLLEAFSLPKRCVVEEEAPVPAKRESGGPVRKR